MKRLSFVFLIVVFVMVASIPKLLRVEASDLTLHKIYVPSFFSGEVLGFSNGDFEAGGHVGLLVPWEEAGAGWTAYISDFQPFYPIRCDFGWVCTPPGEENWPITAASGHWLAGLGTRLPYSLIEDQLNQRLLLTPNSYIEFDYNIISTESCGYIDYLEIRINGHGIVQYDLCRGSHTHGEWVHAVVPTEVSVEAISVVTFAVRNNGSFLSRIWFDNVCLKIGSICYSYDPYAN